MRQSAMMMKSHLAVMLALLLAVLTIMTPVSSLSMVPLHTTTSISTATRSASIATTNSNSNNGLSRSAFLSSTAAAMMFLPMTAAPSYAATTDPALKGTKKDPAFEACLSQCMYDCTKPKGIEQKSRTECLPECKQKCATTKAQLLKGRPVSSTTSM